MCKFGKVLVSCLVVLLPLLGAGAFPCVHAEETLPAVQRTRFSTGVTSIENLEVEYYVTSTGQSGRFTMTGEFELPDGSSVTADPVYSGTCIPASGTSASQNMQSCNLTPRVNGVNTTYGHHESEFSWGDSASVTLTGTLPSSSDVVYTSVSYEVVQHIFIGFNTPVYGYCSVGYTMNDGRSINSVKFPVQNNAAYYSYSSSTRSGTMSFRSFGEATISVDLIEYHFGETSLPSKSYQPIITIDSSTWSYGDMVAYEEPVKDVTSHNLLTSILESLDGSNGQQSAVDSVNQNVNDSVSGLSTHGNSIHNTEDSVMNAMDTALNDSSLQVDVSNTIRGNDNLVSSLNWVSSQITRVVTGFNDITPMWEFMFVLPLLLGIALVIIGRMR